MRRHLWRHHASAAVPHHRRTRSRESPAPLILGAAAFLIAYYVGRSIVRPRLDAPSSLRTSPTSTERKEELLRVYDLPPSFVEEPPHLTPVDPSTLIPRGTMRTIDEAHRNGLLHTGHLLFVMDSSGSLLFMQRSADVVTCPSTWSILGEHSSGDEGGTETVVRGLEEELGLIALNFDKSDFRHAWTVELHPRDNMKESYKVTVQDATEFPLYYIRHYGPRNDDRIDRQLTYLWIVHFPKRHEEIRWQLDDEVADHKWVKLDEVATWLANDKANDNAEFKSEGGVRDDGPDEGDFCHRTIRSLLEAGLMRML